MFQLSLMVTYWMRIYSGNNEINSFPMDLIQLIVNFFLCTKYRKSLTFHKAYKSSYVILWQDNKIAKCLSDTGYVLVDCTPVIRGFSVWRVKVL